MTSNGAGVYRSSSEIDFGLSDLPGLPLPDAVLFVRPTYFQVDYVINPHMEGHVGRVDVNEAACQWEALVGVYRDLGYEIHVIEGQPGLPDMVFSANQTLPSVDRDGSRSVILSNMATDERRQEIEYFESFFRNMGYGVIAAPDAPFEGMGDATWHFDRRLLWIGTGYRSAAESVAPISTAIETKVIELKLVDPHFYHLDTCLSILNSETALWAPSAFDRTGQDLIKNLISNPIPVPIDEAMTTLACNAHCPDGRHVIIQAGSHETNRRLKDHGFEVIECETGEFLKAGGSVFCAKLMFWAH